MKKILLAIDPSNMRTEAIDFACYLARLTHSSLTGVFLEDIQSEIQPASDTTAIRQGGASPEKTGDAPHPHSESIRMFKESCECRGILAHVHRDRGIPLDEILQESRFADILVVDPETSFSPKNESLPGRFVKDVFEEAECPVIVSPYSFEAIDEILFAYNGSRSSVYAIKQFTYLFPELNDREIVIVDVKSGDETGIEEQYRMKEWLKQHYAKVEFKILRGDASDQLFGYLIEKKNGLVVMGAYGRGMLSRFFKPSHARLIVKTVNLPIFITHF